MSYKCHDCGSDLRLIEELDTYVCDKCDMWVEDKCSDKTCEYCTSRTNKPSQYQPTHNTG